MINYLHNLLFYNGVQAAPCKDEGKLTKVFMYGTLKKGEPNHKILTDPKNGIANFVTKGKTEKQYPMIIATKFHMPFLLDSPGKGCHVEGEIYDVNDKMLAKIDLLKDHPKLYEREEENIVMKNPKTDVFEPTRCWVYFQKIVTPELLARPCMAEYSSNGPHGLPYLSNTTASKDNLKDAI